MSTAEHCHVFIDCNMMLHYRSLDQIDWRDLTKHNRVTLEIAPVLIQELERHKVHNPSRKLRDRAQSAVKWLSRRFDDQVALVSPSIGIHFLVSEPQINWALNYLDPSMGDDRLIASVLDFRSGTDDKIFVASGDLGLRIKTLSRTIDIIAPSERYASPNELDESEKEIAAMRRQIAKYESRSPRLIVQGVREDGEVKVEIKLSKQFDSLKNTSQIRAENPLIGIPISHAELQLGLRNSIATFRQSVTWNAENAFQYNNYLNNYYEEYDKYIAEEMMWRLRDVLTFELTLLVKNIGSAPEGNMDGRLMFPVGVCPTNTVWSDKRPKPPKLRHRTPLTLHYAEPDLRARISVPYPLAINPDRLSIDEQARTVSFKIANLKHHNSKMLQAMTVFFEEERAAKTFELSYWISGEEMVDPAEGKVVCRVGKYS